MQYMLNQKILCIMTHVHVYAQHVLMYFFISI